MSLTTKDQLCLKDKRLVFITLCLTCTILTLAPARAEPDPFQMDTSHWMSFEHYKDADQRGKLPLNQVTLPKDDRVSDTSVPPSPEQPSESAPSASAVVTAPAHPVDLPVMPGMNKGFSVKVDSTDDDKTEIIAKPVLDNQASTADIRLNEKNWQSPIPTVRAHKQDDDDGSEDAPLEVRLSYLPDAKIVPVPRAEHMKASTLSHAIVAQQEAARQAAIAAKNVKTPEQRAACAAIDAYKKAQLEALKGDQQTLKALQEAIASLGLQKELGFIAGGQSLTNMGATAGEQVNNSRSLIDLPPASAH